MTKEGTAWYASWFNSPYYHILYKDRDHDEAGAFMKSLTSFLNLEKGSSILDLACGKGRHSKFLAEMGYDVTGVDLSPLSIAEAKPFENENLHFEIHDMCEAMPKQFDAVFNLFTSFGYFESENDNLRTIKAIKKELKPKGCGVIDFLNSKFIIENLIPSEEKTVNGITFHISRRIENNYIFKDIKFADNGNHFSFTEKVKALTLNDFEIYFKKAGVKLLHTFGDYKLNDFEESRSPRLILIFGR